MSNRHVSSIDHKAISSQYFVKQTVADRIGNSKRGKDCQPNNEMHTEQIANEYGEIQSTIATAVWSNVIAMAPQPVKHR